ncbi:LysM peptidoglycan-binding domain-containing protein [Vibrio japonicus]|uniref:LysM domain-containing protein n=1 Tax=Vibrio japonicus TaxID=1824638 RepID=A0ABY5LHZ7_9VIBR|nr:LysM domain-containing protein [Vibrio japonicus]UUM31659.1 LysM domain-containing protein [Vibrio japonicus]
MSQTYTIKPGDTLWQVAIEQQVDFPTLLELNPQYQENPDFIRVGETLTLPDNTPLEEVKPKHPVEPVSDLRELAETSPLFAPPLCQSIDVHDVIFLTGDGPLEYWLLDEKAAKELEKESQKTDLLLNNYKEILESAPKGSNATHEAMEEHARKKEAWLADANYAEMFATEEVQNNPASQRVAKIKANQQPTNFNLKRARATKRALEQRKAFVEKYHNTFFSEGSTETLRKHVLESIQKEIDYYLNLEAEAEKKKPESVTKVGIKANADGTALHTRKIKRHVAEVYSVSHGRYVYIRSRFLEREEKRWQRSYTHTKAMKALEQKDYKGFGKAVAEDIKESQNTLKITSKLAQWKAEGNKWVEWKATQDILQYEGKTIFAVSAEAQLFRWGAQATAVSDFEPAKGRIDLGIGTDASVSLAEAKAEAKLYLPHEKGFAAQLNYRDANGENATYSFGCFRLNGTVSIGCFIGAAVEGEGKAGKSAKQNENGESVGVLFTPRINLAKSPKGQVGFKAQGFAGGNVSGQVLGGIEWQAPEGEKPVSFNALAQISVAANIGAGAGFGADFQLSLTDGKFYLMCSGQLIWGVGGGGGFGVLIDGEQLWELTLILLKALQYVDYRYLNNISEEAYKHLLNSTLVSFARDLVVDPSQTFEKVLLAGETQVETWKQDFEDIMDRQRKANALATRILDESTLSGVPFEQMLPEAVGIMLDILVEEFLLSFNEQQESAIYKLLSESAYSWHKFEEILQCMNPAGQAVLGDKVMFDNLARINAILDNTQQHDFNLWVTQLAEKGKSGATGKPYTPLSGDALTRKKAQITARDDDYLPYR